MLFPIRTVLSRLRKRIRDPYALHLCESVPSCSQNANTLTRNRTTNRNRMTSSSTPAESSTGSTPVVDTTQVTTGQTNTPVVTTPPAVATVQGNTPTVQDLGTVTFNSPSRDRRNQRRDSLVTAEALAAMRLSNEVIGDRGLGYPVDRVTRTLFTNPIPNPVNASTTTTTTTVPPRTIKIDGRTLTLKQSPNDKDSFKSPRMWDKEAQAGLNAEEKMAFVDSAMGYVLPKSSKLALVSTKTDNKGLLQHVHSLQLQLKQLKLHVENHDLMCSRLLSRRISRRRGN